MTEEMIKEMEFRRKVVARSLAISCTAANAPTESFMRALDEYVEGTLTLEQLNENIDAMMYLD